ncbi:MAG: InlB B-repeat-containing protein, partial [Clostridia bacterium]|nr:InlB B-repeat-containing protein [Clostridia bacterium]
EGTLAEGTETTLTTVNGKVTLPGATASTENWHFVGWYDAEEGGNEVNATTVLLEGRTLYARYVRDNGIWVGNQLAKSLVTNTGADHVQYWFGQDERVELEKDSEVSIYMGGKLISFWISGSCVDTSKASTEKIPSATVTRDASFVIYLNDYSSESNPDNWTCEFIGTAASYDTTDELPTGCKGIEVKTIDDKTITLYFVNPAGEAINGDNAHKYQLYAWDGVAVEGSTSTEPFKGWTANPTLNTAITASCGIVKTTSWKLHWDGGESSAFSSLEADKAYVITLKIKDGGDCEVYEYVGEADILTPYDAPEEDEREFVQGGYYLVGNGGFTTANFALDKKCYIDPTVGLEVPLTTTDSYKIVVCDYNANYEDGKHIDWNFNPKYEMAAGKEDGFLNLPGSSNGSVKVGGKYTITIVGEGEDMKFVFTPDESLVPNLSTVDNNDYYIRGLGGNWDNVTTQPKLTKAEDKNEFTIKCPLEVGDTFKIADASWNVQFGFSAIQDSANVADYFENDYGNIKCLVAGNYTFTITTDINNAANNTITWEYKALTPTEPEEAE